MARHTFATTITLSQRIPIETVSKMLGHTSKDGRKSTLRSGHESHGRHGGSQRIVHQKESQNHQIIKP
ncbi:hypothetical protein [Bacteroides xylanisolvens]|uniref:hypothetical protein n=1 Tax=Bacteroides xylanisolvens TaxID=371601 RepID=UPI0021D22265|nr:hypothetical protein [Bacteroides xylanisolvens]